MKAGDNTKHNRTAEQLLKKYLKDAGIKLNKNDFNYHLRMLHKELKIYKDMGRNVPKSELHQVIKDFIKYNLP